RRSKWQGRIEQIEEGIWRVTPPSDPDATLLVRDAQTEPASIPWHGRGRMMPDAEPFYIRSDVAPMLNLNGAPDSAKTFVASEGYSVVTNGAINRALPLHAPDNFGPADERPLSEAIERADHPLVRLW